MLLDELEKKEFICKVCISLIFFHCVYIYVSIFRKFIGNSPVDFSRIRPGNIIRHILLNGGVDVSQKSNMSFAVDVVEGNMERDLKEQQARSVEILPA